jgi:hypothetical protein
MSDEAAGTNGAASIPDMGGPTDYSWIGDIVEQAVISQHEAALIRNQSQHDPCGMAAYLRELMGTSQGDLLTGKWHAVREKAAFLPVAIGDSLRNLGNAPPGTDLAGGKPLAEFLFDTLGANKLIPPQDQVAIGFLCAALPPSPPQAIMACQLQFIADRLPSGITIANGSFLNAPSKRDGGTKVSSRLYITNNEYRGVAFKAAVLEWIDYQAENVTTGALANAREDLIRMVGTFQGSGEYGLWSDNDPVLPGSELGRLLTKFENMTELAEHGQALCDQFNIADSDRLDRALEGQINTINAEIERKQRRDQYAIVAAAVLGALFLVKKK